MAQVFGTEPNRILNYFPSGLHWVVCVHSGDTRNVGSNRYKPNSIAAIKHSLLFYLEVMMCLEREILNSIGFETPQLEPEQVDVQIEQAVEVDEPIANTIDNFGKILEQYEPVSS
ncbi:hypothetical protein I8752_22110 [Nostocaceae cyanobacterium CENA369]|uniref:Uncharacterized protein n=1 Tax=Dendronalium phyllosphericum CENA369 TaxID=1725256 RepID=A0A8J7IBK7_9NOST|nr:hypothetical protein [Dendronalium phyllosphericum]MBH8575652.1 hypothetical protein [Dendronalium phyllosphericum CENA369]